MTTDWFLTRAERGNPATRIDEHRPDGLAWSAGNEVRPLIHGSTYFADLVPAIERMVAGDLLLFTDWRGDADERLHGRGTELARLLCEAAGRGVDVRGLLWRSHRDMFHLSQKENRQLARLVTAAGGECLLDMRVRKGGSHHQKFVVLRHPKRPDLDVAYVGGIDLCHSRNDDEKHAGDPQEEPIADAYGPRPPWHDAQVAIAGPAVGDVEAVFRERWDDPTAPTRHPARLLRNLLLGTKVEVTALPEQVPDPAPRGTHAVQLLRTYPYRRRALPYAPLGERSIALGYRKALARARKLIYVEDQYLWSADIAQTFADALRAEPELRLIFVVPRLPDQKGWLSRTPELYGRAQAMAALTEAGGDRVAVYSPENRAGTPVYVHAKICVIDDQWASIGSDNINRRSWTHDSELSCAIVDTNGDFAQRLRLTLAREHLERDADDDRGLGEAGTAFRAFATSAATLDAWHAAGRTGPRPPGRLRVHHQPVLATATTWWARPLYRLLYDPDGRPPALRRKPGLAL